MTVSNIRSRLLPSERILWEGAPASGLLFTPRDFFLIPFSCLWLGFVVFWTHGAISSGAPFFFYALGGVFLAIGLFVAIGRFAFDAWLRKRTRYAVTDQRLLIMRSAPLARFTSLQLHLVPEVSLSGENRRHGSLRFGSGFSLFASPNLSIWVPALDPTPQFIAIEKPAAVFATIMDARRRAAP